MRSVLVTGGSRGLGLAIARTLVGAGYRVIAVARKKTDELDSLIEGHRLAGEASLHFVPFDLAEIENIPPLVRSLRKQFGPLYALVNNAAVAFDGALPLTHDSHIERLVRVNTLSPIVLTKYIARHMMADGGGRIVNIASIIAFTGYSGLSVYGATKASLIGFTRSLARELGRMNVTVNAVAPGFMRTDLTSAVETEQLEQVARRSALRHLPDVNDVAHAVEYLLDDRARSITGTVLTVDAGSTA